MGSELGITHLALDALLGCFINHGVSPFFISGKARLEPFTTLPRRTIRRRHMAKRAEEAMDGAGEGFFCHRHTSGA
jgi:hypothetical protein